jgi:hypothetical protein
MMIRIRYRDLEPGTYGAATYGTAECRGDRTVVYLLPGLTRMQRHAVFRRLRHEARRGCGPPLPAGPLAVGRAVDWVRWGYWRVISVVRLHPVASLVPALLVVGGLVALLLLASQTAASQA